MLKAASVLVGFGLMDISHADAVNPSVQCVSAAHRKQLSLM
jgi:hypothetical protein